MNKKSTHGGRRPGAGGWNRSPHGPLTRTTVQLSDEVRAFLRTQPSQGGAIEQIVRESPRFIDWMTSEK